MTRLEKLKLVLGIEDDEEDQLLNYLLESTEQTILNYCNIRTLPAELEGVLIDMTASRYNSPDGVAANVKIGDTTVRFDKDEDNIINNYKAQLHRFRRLKWV